MKTILAAINAKFIHTNLAVRSVNAYGRERGLSGLSFWEGNINQRYGDLLRRLTELEADVILFSCYIWNIELVKGLAADLRTLFPQMILAAAGPEVSYHSEGFLQQNSAFDLVLPGEGEDVVYQWLMALEQGAEWRQCRGIVFRDGDQICCNEAADVMDLDQLPFAYADLNDLGSRIIYYESMRGCPFRCSYCLSSIHPGVRCRSLELVYQDLDRMLAARVPQVKFVDRTFNCHPQRALQIWRYLADRDNGITNFHFELSADLLTEQQIAFLQQVRPGLFQFEIGVQSMHLPTLEAIQRTTDLEQIQENVQALQQNHNLHLHLDLIAGLPCEDYQQFGRSFDGVYAMEPHQLQLGFLKVLKGSAMEQNAEQFGIRYRCQAPYEVLSTRWLNYKELYRLQDIAEMVELYYNSGRFSHLIKAVTELFQRPFSCYERLAVYYRQQGGFESPVSKTGYYEVLGGFLREQLGEIPQRYQWLCKFDMALHERIRKLPEWVQVDGSTVCREPILDKLSQPQWLQEYLPDYLGKDPKWIAKVVYAERFPFHPVSGQNREVTLLFDYQRRDITGRAFVQEIER